MPNQPETRFRTSRGSGSPLASRTANANTRISAARIRICRTLKRGSEKSSSSSLSDRVIFFKREPGGSVRKQTAKRAPTEANAPNNPPELASLIVGGDPTRAPNANLLIGELGSSGNAGSEEPRIGPFTIDDAEASSRQGDNDRAVLNSDLHVQVVLRVVNHTHNIIGGQASSSPMASDRGSDCGERLTQLATEVATEVATETATETAMRFPATFCETCEKRGKPGRAGDSKTL